jgi:hypothetical protein
MIPLCIVTCLLSSAVTFTASADDSEGFRDLFNGKDLNNWVRTNTPEATWSIKDGMLICSGKPIGELRTDRMYQNFILELEWRHMVPRGNAGVFIWADDITARGVPFHRGIEVQVLENAYGNTKHYTTHGDIFPIHGAKMTPDNGRGGSRSFPTEERSNPSPQWNHYRITCIDGTISLAVNGKVVTSGRDCVPSKGYICLESEGGIVHYRNVRIKELPDSPVDADHVAIADRGYHSVYSGLNLDGWKTGDESLWHSRDWVLGFDGTEDKAGSTLVSDEQVGDFGFVVDVRAKDTYAGTAIRLQTETSDVVVADLENNAAIAEHLEPVGRWNRIEGRLEAGKPTLTVNGHDVDTSGTAVSSAGSGHLTLAAKSATEFSNIYLRPIDE